MFKKYFIVIITLLFLILNVYSVVEVDSCQSIPNNFALDADRIILLNQSISTVGSCFDINLTQDFTFDCGFNTITGDQTGSPFLFETTPLTNITLQNCVFDNFRTQLLLSIDSFLFNLTFLNFDSPGSVLFMFADNIEADNISVFNSNAGDGIIDIRLYSGEFGKMNNINIINNTINLAGHFYIFTDGGNFSNITVSADSGNLIYMMHDNYHFKDVNLDGGSSAVYLRATSDSTFENFYINNSNRGFYFQDSGSGPSNNFISNSVIENTINYDIYLQTANAVSNNYFYGNTFNKSKIYITQDIFGTDAWTQYFQFEYNGIGNYYTDLDVGSCVNSSQVIDGCTYTYCTDQSVPVIADVNLVDFTNFSNPINFLSSQNDTRPLISMVGSSCFYETVVAPVVIGSSVSVTSLPSYSFFSVIFSVLVLFMYFFI